MASGIRQKISRASRLPLPDVGGAYIHAGPTCGKTYLQRTCAVRLVDTDDIWKAETDLPWHKLSDKEREELSRLAIDEAVKLIGQGRIVLSNFFLPLRALYSFWRPDIPDVRNVLTDRGNGTPPPEEIMRAWPEWTRDWQTWSAANAARAIALPAGSFMSDMIAYPSVPYSRF